MKRLLHAMLAILVSVGLLFGIKYQLEREAGLSGSRIVNFYNWGDYIDPDLLKEFEQETGYRVIYETFDSNEAMIAKLSQGGTAYDVVIPSDYMVELMIQKGLIQSLDHAKLPGLSHIDPRFLDLSFDPNNHYSIPYLWGTLGILYNTHYVNEADVAHWRDLWKPEFKNQILLYDGAREVLGLGLQALGYSLNETRPKNLDAAQDKMKALMPNVRALVGDEIKMYMAQQEAYIGITFSGEAAMAMANHDFLAYHVPEEGSNIWFDNLVIPKNAQNVEGAYALINFLLRPDVAARNAEYIGYASPNRDAVALLDPKITTNEAFYPNQETIKHLEVYKNLGPNKLIDFNDRFLQIKIEPK